MQTVEGRRFLITGAAGGIAGPVARVFADAGARMALVDRNFDVVRSRAEDLGGVALGADLSDPAAVQRMVEEAAQALDGIDAVIHTTGGFAMQPAHESGLDLYQRMFTVNVQTLVLTFGAVLPRMLEQGHGFLAAFSAGPGWHHSGGAGMSVYAAAKAAVAAYVHAVQEELGDHAIRTAVVYPMGVVDTPGNRESMPDADRSSWIDPVEIGHALLFAASRGGRGRVGDIPVHPVG